jgi:hypothetical protein
MDLHDDLAGLFWVSLYFPTKSTATTDGFLEKLATRLLTGYGHWCFEEGST